MSNRTVLVDNNTWNNTHIATVGRALASSEEKAYPIMEVRTWGVKSFTVSSSSVYDMRTYHWLRLCFLVQYAVICSLLMTNQVCFCR